MSDSRDVQYCPVRTHIDWSEVQFADFNKVEVARYSQVKYFEPSDSEDEDGAGDGEYLSLPLPLFQACEKLRALTLEHR